VGKTDSPRVAYRAGYRPRKILDRLLDKILLADTVTATAESLRASESSFVGGKQSQLPAGNSNASVAASSTVRSSFPERWRWPSLKCCRVCSVHVYPPLCYRGTLL